MFAQYNKIDVVTCNTIAVHSKENNIAVPCIFMKNAQNCSAKLTLVASTGSKMAAKNDCG